MQVQPYLTFEGRTEEALEFYKRAIGAEVTHMIRFKEVPDAKEHTPPGAEDKIMHSAFRVGDTTLMASDGRCMGKAKFDGISLSLTARDDAEAQKLFNALAENGQVQMPLAKAFFASSFGMLADRFGVNWMVVTAQ